MLVSDPSHCSFILTPFYPYPKSIIHTQFHNPIRLPLIPSSSSSSSLCCSASASASAAGSPNWDSTLLHYYSNSNDQHQWVADRKVKCEVEVISWRERRIKAEIAVSAHPQSVWNAVTDYDRLADFIPNLVSSGTIPCPHPGRIWLEQTGLQRALYWHIEARVVLDLQEFHHSDYHRELRFFMVDGDFKKFEGKWSVKGSPTSTILCYEVNVIPRFNFPAIFLERIIKSDLPVNLRALASRSETNPKGKESSSSSTTTATRPPIRSLSDKVVKDKFPKSSFGPVSPSTGDCSWGIFGKSCSLSKPCVVDEVHLRRYDGLLVISSPLS